ncbi:hypothetical protein HZB90_04965 [archaeon]|nr:hypothetical protein [archaeon]
MRCTPTCRFDFSACTSPPPPPSDGSPPPTGDTTPPGPVTGLDVATKGTTWINWTWVNPTDTDFSKAIIYINGTNRANTSNNYYNASGLLPNTVYQINVSTKDSSENVNDARTPDTATTNVIDCAVQFGEGYVCTRISNLVANESTCTSRKDGDYILWQHCSSLDPPCAITTSPPAGLVVTITTGTCCVKCAPPMTLAHPLVVPIAPEIHLPGMAVLNFEHVDCVSELGSAALCVATETEFQDSCKGHGEMYQTASCLTESGAKGFCALCS